jgi:hypothetical protein
MKGVAGIQPAQSTLFYSERLKARREPKLAQERAAGEVLATYFRRDGRSLVNPFVPSKDPPDQLWDAGDLLVGVELFEVPAFYEERSLLYRFVNLSYLEFARRGLERRLLGVCISLGALIHPTFLKEVSASWKGTVVTKKPLDRAARDLVDLVELHVHTREVVPDNDFGLILKVDASQQPALAALTPWISIRRCGEKTPRRSDGVASPLIIAGGIYQTEPEERIGAVAREIEKKTCKRGNWPLVDYAVLLAHDLPRVQMYEGFPFDWPVWLAAAAQHTNVWRFFDEFWLVTAPTELGSAFRITPKGVECYGAS